VVFRKNICEGASDRRNENSVRDPKGK